MTTKITTISEPLKEGRVEGVLVAEDTHISKYRIAYFEKRKDEWIRFDHKPEEPSHIHIRTATPQRTYVEIKQDLNFLIPLLRKVREHFRGV